MSPTRIGIQAAKAIVLVIASLGALTASLVLATLATVMCSSFVGTAGPLVFIPVAVAGVVASAAALKRLGWAGRVALGALLVASSLLMMPRPMCAAEPQTHQPC